MNRINPEKELNGLLSSLQNAIIFTFDGVDDFINSSNEMATVTSDNIATKIENWNKENPEHEYSGHDIYEADFFKLISFDSKINTASLILIYSLLETELNFICVSVAKIKGITLTRKNLRGQYVFENKEYLEKKFNIDFASIAHLWTEISRYKVLRNEIVHRNSQIVIKDNKDLLTLPEYKALMLPTPLMGCEISGSGLINISTETVKEFSKLSENILCEICELLKDPA